MPTPYTARGLYHKNISFTYQQLNIKGARAYAIGAYDAIKNFRNLIL